MRLRPPVLDRAPSRCGRSWPHLQSAPGRVRSL